MPDAKTIRENAARKALAIDKLIKGPLAESQAWALDNPDPETEKQAQLDEAPSIQSGDVGQRMLTPETRHEAGKDYLKAAATEGATNLALGGAGKAAQAAIAFVPAPKEFARHGISKISAAIPEAAKQKFLAGLDELKANNPFAYDNQVERYQKVFELAEREEARQRLFEQASKATPEDIVLDIISEGHHDRRSGYIDRRTINELYKQRYNNLQHARLQDEIRRLPDDLDDIERRAAVNKLENSERFYWRNSADVPDLGDPNAPNRVYNPEVKEVLAKLVDEGKIAKSTGQNIVPHARGTMSILNPGYWVRGSAESPLGALTRKSELLRQDYLSPENLFNRHLKSIDPKGMTFEGTYKPAKARVLGEDIVQWPLGGGKYGDPAPPGSLSFPEGSPGALSLVDDIPGALSIADDLKRSNK
jgi:hypothetical protein